MTTIEERATRFRNNINADMTSTLRQHGVGLVAVTQDVQDALVDDAMFHIEHLLCEIEDLQNELRVHQERRDQHS